MAKEVFEHAGATAVSEHHDPWAGAAADAYAPRTAATRQGNITEAGLAPGGPYCNPHLPPMSHEQLMQSWGLPSNSHIDPIPMPFSPDKPPPNGFYGNRNPGQPGREHPDPTIQPCVGEPLTS